MLGWSSISVYQDFLAELEKQIKISIEGVCDMFRMTSVDFTLRKFCNDHSFPEPEVMVNEGKDLQIITDVTPEYFSLNQVETEGRRSADIIDQYEKIDRIITKHHSEICGISDKVTVCYHDSDEFCEYFRRSCMVQYRSRLRARTIMIYDDRTKRNVDLLFTVDSVIPVIRNKVKEPIPYLMLASDDLKKKTINALKNIGIASGIGLLGGAFGVIGSVVPMAIMEGNDILDNKSMSHVFDTLRPMIDEICEALI